MEGQPAQFESIGNRLGFHVLQENSRWLKLAWQGPRFSAFLCLGIALLLLFVSVPIVLALRLRGFVSEFVVDIRTADMVRTQTLNLMFYG